MRLFRRLSVILLVCSLFLPSMTPVAYAAKKAKISKKKLTLQLGTDRDWNEISIKNISKKVKKVKWTNSNKKVVSISPTGAKKRYLTIIAKKKGTATITAKVGKKKFKCKVTVKNKFRKDSIEENDNTIITPTPQPTTPAFSGGKTEVTTTPTPTVKPDMEIPESPFSKLKKYILENGEQNSSGNYFVKIVITEEHSTCSYAIIYDSANEEFDFVSIGETDTGSQYSLELRISEEDVLDGYVQCVYVIPSITFSCKESLEVELSEISSSNNFEWTKIFSTHSGADIDELTKNLFNSVLDVSYSGWNILLLETGQFSGLVQFGFGV